MNNEGLSCREIERHLGRNDTLISLVRTYLQTNDVKDRSRPGQPRNTGRSYDLVDFAPFP